MLYKLSQLPDWISGASDPSFSKNLLSLNTAPLPGFAKGHSRVNQVSLCLEIMSQGIQTLDNPWEGCFHSSLSSDSFKKSCTAFEQAFEESLEFSDMSHGVEA